MTERYELPVLFTEEERNTYAAWGIKKEKVLMPCAIATVLIYVVTVSYTHLAGIYQVGTLLLVEALQIRDMLEVVCIEITGLYYYCLLYTSGMTPLSFSAN